MKLTVRLTFGLAFAWSIFGMTGCGSTIQLTPAPLEPLTNTTSIGQAWQSSVGGRVAYPLQPTALGQTLAVADSQGVVALIKTDTGADIWRIKLQAEISAGVGFDGQTAALTTLDNELVAIQSVANSAKVLWRKRLPARVYTAPVVAGGRIFVLAGDRSVQAFDASTGAKLWNFQRASDPLILNQAGTLGVYRNSLIVGHSGRLLALNPDNGQVQWEASVATTRATNDIERLIDLADRPNRVGDSICVRAYQAAVACVDARRGATTWSKVTQGATGVSGDAEQLASTESDGRVKLWSRQAGALLWESQKLAYRGLSAPLLIGNSIVVGDAEGYVHVMNKADGVIKARFKTDGSAIAVAPVAAGSVVMVVTARGGIFAFSPQ
ncbi:MAG: outer membrane protein assembly factor BamB [Cytophagales bacterium]|nr:outer membrane protein assembly factor BamB [Cytophagales bacterium]